MARPCEERSGDAIHNNGQAGLRCARNDEKGGEQPAASLKGGNVESRVREGLVRGDSHPSTHRKGSHRPPAEEAVVVRFAGDSGDGMQLTGGQFTLSTALAGNDLATFPDFPAEIRAPQGTTFGVSAFQINFGSTAIDTAGDEPDVLVAMNPAALKVNADAGARRRAADRRRGRVHAAQPRQGGL